MDRTPPAAKSDEIELYIRTYYSLLRSTGPVRIRSLEETHTGMRSNLCLLYTSDAADERSSVDLGGRRIIKKKKKKHREQHSHHNTTQRTHNSIIEA